jgi:uncharacterized protein DUF6879
MRRFKFYGCVVANAVITLEQLAADFTSLFRRRVFRLECLDFYDAPNEHEPYSRFCAGEPVDPEWRKPWQAFVRGIRESGRTMQRVHVVSEPVTRYVQFSLLHGYPASVEAGEDVRILAGQLAQHSADYWLFDDDLAAVLVYDQNGTIVRVELEQDVTRYCDMRDEVLHLAVPLAQYVYEHNITDGRTRVA